MTQGSVLTLKKQTNQTLKQCRKIFICGTSNRDEFFQTFGFFKFIKEINTAERQEQLTKWTRFTSSLICRQG